MRCPKASRNKEFMSAFPAGMSTRQDAWEQTTTGTGPGKGSAVGPLFAAIRTVFAIVQEMRGLRLQRHGIVGLINGSALKSST